MKAQSVGSHQSAITRHAQQVLVSVVHAPVVPILRVRPLDLPPIWCSYCVGKGRRCLVRAGQVGQRPFHGVVDFCPLVDLCGYQNLWDLICSFLSGGSLSMLGDVHGFCHATRLSPSFNLRRVDLCPLVALCGHQDIWDSICSFVSGDSLSLLADEPVFCQATRRSKSFTLLCGRNDAGSLCPWRDIDNVLRQPFVGWSDQHFRLRHSNTRESVRLADLGEVIRLFCRHKLIHMNPLYCSVGDDPPDARSSSSFGSPCRGPVLQPVFSPMQSPPCFPVELHRKEAIRRWRYVDVLAYTGSSPGSEYSDGSESVGSPSWQPVDD